MRSRRSFFAKIGAIAAAVALAPEIAFGPLNVTKQVTGELNLDELFSQLYAIKRARNEAGIGDDEIVIYCYDKETAERIFAIADRAKVNRTITKNGRHQVPQESRG